MTETRQAALAPTRPRLNRTQLRLSIAAAGCSLMLAGCGSGAHSGSGSISMPDRVGDLQAYATYCDTWAKETGGDAGKCGANAKANGAVNQAAASNLATAYGGSAVASTMYIGDDFGVQLTTFAVRAQSPLLWSRQDTSEYNESAGTAVVETVVRDGASECLARPANGIIYAGTSYTEANLFAYECQATGEGLTVRVEGSVSVRQALDFTNLLFSELGGSQPPDGSGPATPADTNPISMPGTVNGIEAYAGFCGTQFAANQDNVDHC